MYNYIIAFSLDVKESKVNENGIVTSKNINSNKEVLIEDELSCKYGTSNDTGGRRRKKKKLPDDFISLDDIEDITDLTTGVELSSGKTVLIFKAYLLTFFIFVVSYLFSVNILRVIYLICRLCCVSILTYVYQLFVEIKVIFLNVKLRYKFQK